MDSIQLYERFNNMVHSLHDNYETIANYSADSDQKVFLGDKANKVCRFCGRKEGEVKFLEDAHALSNMIGNNRIFSYYECDECNTALFSVFESNFAEYMKLRHTLSQTHGKRGVPSYKPNSQSFSRIDVKGSFTTKLKEDEEPIAEVDFVLQGNDMQLIFAPTTEDLNQYVKPEYLYLELEEKIVNEDVFMDMHFDSYKEEDLTNKGTDDE